MTFLGKNHELLEIVLCASTALIDGWSPWTWQSWQWQPATLFRFLATPVAWSESVRFKKGSDLQCWFADVMIFYQRSGYIRNHNLWFCLGDFVGSLVLLVYSICLIVIQSLCQDWTSSERSFISANLGDSPMEGFQVLIYINTTCKSRMQHCMQTAYTQPCIGHVFVQYTTEWFSLSLSALS